MRNFLLFTLFFFLIDANGLEITIAKGLEEKEPYSVVNLENDEPFLCQEQKDDFGKTKEVICSFTKVPKIPIKL